MLEWVKVQSKMKDKRTYADRREELKVAVAKRRRKIKQLAILYKGGRCQVCGYSKYQGALDLHHIGRDKKDFGIADRGHSRSWVRVKTELKKCVLVCANCHREVEAGVIKIPTHKYKIGNESVVAKLIKPRSKIAL